MVWIVCMSEAVSSRPSVPEESLALGEALVHAIAGCQDRLLGMLYYQTGTREGARDAIQQTFARCWRRLDNVPPGGGLESWVFRIALGVGRNLRARAWRHPPPTIEEDGIEGRIRAALFDLAAEQQEVFLLRQNGRLSYPQIAGALHLGVADVESRMRQALEVLRQAVNGDLPEK